MENFCDGCMWQDNCCDYDPICPDFYPLNGEVEEDDYITDLMMRHEEAHKEDGQW